MKRPLIAVVFVVVVSASCQSCLAQTNVTSVCLHGWNVAGTNAVTATLHWTNSGTNADGIGIERSLTPLGPWLLVGTVGPTVTSYTDRTGLCLISYWYRIYAFNAAGTSGYSNTAGPAIKLCL